MAHDADAQRPAVLAAPRDLHDVVDGGVGGGQERTGVPGEALAGGGGGDGGAVQERRAEVAFELLHMAGDGGRGEEQPRRGPPEVALLDHRQEGGQSAEIHAFHGMRGAGPPGNLVHDP